MIVWVLGAALVAGLLGSRLPLVVARLPEPLVQVDRPQDEDPKPLYRDLARTPNLALAGALSSAVVAAALTWVLRAHRDSAQAVPDRVVVVLALLVPLGVTLSFIDARTRLLPRRLVLPATLLVLALVLGEWAFSHETHVLVRSLVAMAAARTFYWLFWFIRSAGLGFGDVRLAALLGLVLGRLGWDTWLIGLYGGFLIFGLYALGLAVVRRDRSVLKRALPFGPFMLTGATVGVLVAPVLHVV